MEKLGYVVSDRKIRGIKGFVEVVDDISKIPSGQTKPVLVVGYNKAKTYFGDGISLLNRKISNNVFWTFLKTEKRVDFEDDIEKFYKFVIEYHINHLKYFYVNIITFNYNKLKRLLSLFYKGKVQYIYINDKMLYFLYYDDKTDAAMSMGISIQVLKYCGYNVEKIMNKLRSIRGINICNNASDCVKVIRDEIIGKEYSIPYFMSLA